MDMTLAQLCEQYGWKRSTLQKRLKDEGIKAARTDTKDDRVVKYFTPQQQALVAALPGLMKRGRAKGSKNKSKN